MPQLYDVPVTLPAIPADEPDVIVTRRLRVSVDGAPFVTIDVPAATTTHVLSGVPENAVVDVTHALVDDAGLEGPESPVSRITVADTVAPLGTAAVNIGTPVPVRGASPPTPPPPPPTGRRLLRKEDIVYRGHYRGTGGDGNYANGLYHRYVDGVLRVGRLDFRGNLPGNTHRWDCREYTLPDAFGGSIVAAQNYGDIWNQTYLAGGWEGLHHEPAASPAQRGWQSVGGAAVRAAHWRMTARVDRVRTTNLNR